MLIHNFTKENIAIIFESLDGSRLYKPIKLLPGQSYKLDVSDKIIGMSIDKNGEIVWKNFIPVSSSDISIEENAVRYGSEKMINLVEKCSDYDDCNTFFIGIAILSVIILVILFMKYFN